jgi:hypothetical protein
MHGYEKALRDFSGRQPFFGQQAGDLDFTVGKPAFP